MARDGSRTAALRGRESLASVATAVVLTLALVGAARGQDPEFARTPASTTTPLPTAEPTGATEPSPQPTATAPQRSPTAEPSPGPSSAPAPKRSAPKRSVQRKSRARQSPRRRKRASRRRHKRPEAEISPIVFYDAKPTIPVFLLAIYREAARDYNVPWQVLAAINEVESAFGRHLGPSIAGAVGWMQFMPATWLDYGLDADGDGLSDPASPRDAIFAAARYLDGAGASGDLEAAIFAYNHAQWYVDAVLLRAGQIGADDAHMSTRELEERVLADTRIAIYDCGREDIRRHRIDRRVLMTLDFLASMDLAPTVTGLRCEHSLPTSGDEVSERWTGNSADIVALGGVPVQGRHGPDRVTESALRHLRTLRAAMEPRQTTSRVAVSSARGTRRGNHAAGQLHVSFHPTKAQRRRAWRAVRERRRLERAQRAARWMLIRVGSARDSPLAAAVL